MRAIGFQAGQRGDLILGTVAARAFKEQNPKAKLTLGLHKQYEDMLPLFGTHEYYSDYHLWHTYAGWPGGEDNLFLAKNQFDIVFHAMPQRHNEADWWKTESQSENVCSVYGLKKPSSLQCNLTKWFDVPDYKGYIAFAPIGGFQDWPNKKSFSLERAAQVVAMIKSMGYSVVQMGGASEPIIEGATKPDLNYFEMTKVMLGCKALVTIDSGRAWLSSAYSFPTLGLYSTSYYGPEFIHNIQPINKNAIYLSAPLVNDIELDVIAARLNGLTS